MSGYIASLKGRVLRAEAEVLELRSMLDAFWTGNCPEQSTLDHLVLAKWGRKRLEEKVKKPALLGS